MGDLASLYAIESPALSEDLDIGNVIGLEYKVSSRIRKEQLKVEVYDYDCETLLSNNSQSFGVQLGNLVQLPADDDDKKENKQPWLLLVKVHPPSASQRLLQSWHRFQGSAFAAVEDKAYSRLYNVTKNFYSNTVSGVLTAVRGIPQSTTLEFCVRWMIYTMDPTDPNALEVTFDRTQLLVHFQQQQDDSNKMEIATVGMQPVKTAGLLVSVGGGQKSGEAKTKKATALNDDTLSKGTAKKESGTQGLPQELDIDEEVQSQASSGNNGEISEATAFVMKEEAGRHMLKHEEL